MSEPFIGQVMMFAGNFAPRGWAFCQGQILSIAQNTALFSILGTTYGGNGQTTFALPDLRGRSPIQPGQGPGLSPITLGQQGGTETMTLLSNNMPAHNHTLNAFNGDVGNAANPSGNALGIGKVPSSGEMINMYSNSAPSAQLAPGTVGIAGGSQPFNIRDPYLAINFIIALEGIFPSRN